MTELLRIGSHPLAQPVRCKAGWLLACHMPSDHNEMTLLIDMGPTDQRPEWDLLPDGMHRTLLMLDSPQLVRLHFVLPYGPPRTVKGAAVECTIMVVGSGKALVQRSVEHYYDLLITYPEGFDPRSQ